MSLPTRLYTFFGGKGDEGGFATDGDIDGRGESRRTNRQGEEVQENKVVVFFFYLRQPVKCYI
jgi:hypothetical protein